MEDFEKKAEHSPLTYYRAQATFKATQLKQFLENDDTLQFKEYITKILREDPIFARNSESLSSKAYHELNHKRWKRLVEYDFIDNNCFGKAMNRVRDLMEILDTYDQGLSNRYFLSSGVFCLAILTMGTERHHDLMQKCVDNEIVGCFCLTELGHGSNTRDIETECHFKDGHFVLHTPNISAIKCWAGNLSYSATHAIVYAQLYINDACKGLHAFCLQIRNLDTLEPLPGIVIGDMGEKLGEWNGVENGWMKFDHHVVPLDCLLNQASDVTADGQFIVKNENIQQQRSKTMGTISFGRIILIGKAALAMQLSAVIAIRYSAARKHFIADNRKEEQSILEFPMQQRRIFPILSTAIAFKLFYKKFFQHYVDYLDSIMSSTDYDDTVEAKRAMIREIHTISCAAKAVTTTRAIEALSEIRAACGGHGCLKYSRLNDLYDSFDSSRTYEGENNVLLQHTANILLSLSDNSSLSSPFGSFLVFHMNPVKFECWEQRIVQDVTKAYEWLICYLAEEGKAKIEENVKSGMNEAMAKSAAFYDYCQPLTTAYVEYMVLTCFCETVEQAIPSIRMALDNLLKIYATSTIQKHIGTLYYGGYTENKSWQHRIANELNLAISELKDDSVLICDELAPDDFLLHSLLGKSDGKMEKHLWEQFKTKANLRPDWWPDLVQFLKKD